MEKLKYIDLFAGCGGLSLGLHNSARWEGMFAVEKSSDAFQTLSFNLLENRQHFDWPKWLSRTNHDINSVIEKHYKELVKLRGKVDLVAGGPPCQGFSFAGRRIEKDQRNNLVYSYLEFIKLVRPKAILFENVKGFKIGFKKSNESRGIPYSDLVLNELKKMGYNDAEARILNFAEFGVPQSRSRCIIVATQNNSAKDFFDVLKAKCHKFLKDRNIPRTPTLKSAISDIQRIHGEGDSTETPNFKEGRYSIRPHSSYQRLMRGRLKGQPDSHRFANHTQAVERKFSCIIENQLTSKEVCELFNTKKCSTKLLEADKPTPTLTTLPDDYVHYCEPRILTVREYARIQSFPDWYQFKGKYTTGGKQRKIEVPRYSQIGNAIPPLFAEQAGIVLGSILDGKRS